MRRDYQLTVSFRAQVVKFLRQYHLPLRRKAVLGFVQEDKGVIRNLLDEVLEARFSVREFFLLPVKSAFYDPGHGWAIRISWSTKVLPAQFLRPDIFLEIPLPDRKDVLEHVITHHDLPPPDSIGRDEIVRQFIAPIASAIIIKEIASVKERYAL